jgi:hypothetical protein
MVQRGYFGRGEEGEREEDDLVLRVFPRYVSAVTDRVHRADGAGVGISPS